MKDTLDALRQKAAACAERQKARSRANYKLARSLGFSGGESRIMAGWSQERILDLAKQKES